MCRRSRRVDTLAAELEPRCQQSHPLVRGWAPSSTRWNRGTSSIDKLLLGFEKVFAKLVFIITKQVSAGGGDDIGMVEKRGGHGPLLRFYFAIFFVGFNFDF